MAKLKNPLASLRASGGLGNALSFAHRKAVDLVMKKPQPLDARSGAQVSWRSMFNMCVDLWHELSPAEKREWETAGTIRHMTGYAWYLSQCLRPNPGIYLPLVGGTMSGDIVMGSNRVSGLPAPTLAHHATRKAYVDGLDRGEGHINIILWNYQSIGQGTWAISTPANVPLNYHWRNTTTANGDNLSYKLYLDKATYTLRLLYYSHGNAPIVDFDIDAVEVASFDLYEAPGGAGRVQSQAGIVVSDADLKTLRLRVDGKNALSGDFAAYLGLITLWRTA